MRKLIYCALALVMLAACSTQPPSGIHITCVHEALEPRQISTQDAKAMLATGDVLLLDVRTIEEFEQGYIAGAIHLPLEQVLAQVAQHATNNSQSIIVYCRSGRRSLTAAQLLSAVGYYNVYNLTYGIEGWE